jgi:hypothetical protein
MKKEYPIAHPRQVQPGLSLAVSSRLDAELVELRLKRGALQAQACGCAIGAAELTAALPKSAQDAFAFLVVESCLIPTLVNGYLQFG